MHLEICPRCNITREIAKTICIQSRVERLAGDRRKIGFHVRDTEGWTCDWGLRASARWICSRFQKRHTLRREVLMLLIKGSRPTLLMAVQVDYLLQQDGHSVVPVHTETHTHTQHQVRLSAVAATNDYGCTAGRPKVKPNHQRAFLKNKYLMCDGEER